MELDRLRQLRGEPESICGELGVRVGAMGLIAVTCVDVSILFHEACDRVRVVEPRFVVLVVDQLAQVVGAELWMRLLEHLIDFFEKLILLVVFKVFIQFFILTRSNTLLTSILLTFGETSHVLGLLLLSIEFAQILIFSRFSLKIRCQTSGPNRCWYLLSKNSRRLFGRIVHLSGKSIAF